MRSRAALARRRLQCKKAMRYAASYEEWARAAKVLDKMSEQVSESDFYDEELIRNRLEELRRRREEGSLRDVVFCMRGDLVRNLGNMCNPELHKGRLEVISKPSLSCTSSCYYISVIFYIEVYMSDPSLS